MPVIDAIRRTSVTTLEAMTQALNQRGIRSARAGRRYASPVSNLLALAARFPKRMKSNRGRLRYAHRPFELIALAAKMPFFLISCPT
jgi:hypothetical protein